MTDSAPAPGPGEPIDGAPPEPGGPSDDELRLWGLVLDSQGIPNQLARGAAGWTLVVDGADAERAAAALSAYYVENQGRRAAEAAPRVAEPAAGWRAAATLAGLAAVLLMAAFHLLVVMPDPTGRWVEAGAARSGPLLAGEPWRAVTALTLHADLGHLVANGLAGALFLVLLFSAVGPGLGAWLVLAAGVLGNLLNAALRGPGFGGVGASTAIFGAIGLLAGLRFGRYRRARSGRGEAWAAIFAALMLLALAGLNPETDVLAHVWGFAAGLGLGLVVGRLPPLALGPRAQWLLAAGALAVVALAWALALARA